MEPAHPVTTSDGLSEARRRALLTLLADDDPAAHNAAREQLLAQGPGVREWLRPHLLSDDPGMRRGVREVFDHFGRQTADNRFLAFCLKQGENLDLELGALLLSQTRHADTNLEAYQALLDDFAGTLRERLRQVAGAQAVLNTINKYLFVELGLSGNQEDYYNPDNSYLTRVLDRRVGIPISLCTIYLALARRLRLPVAGIGMPGHFLCRFQTSTEEIYIDCFHRGRLMTKADCVHYLLSGNHELRDESLQPLTPRRSLMRMCGNLHRIYYHHRDVAETTRLQRYLVALAR
jgi:regulator of sirC expression with transglutaminase-like and TPR domain